MVDSTAGDGAVEVRDVGPRPELQGVDLLPVGVDRVRRSLSRSRLHVLVGSLVAALLVLLAQGAAVPAGARSVVRSGGGLAEQVAHGERGEPAPFRPASDSVAPAGSSGSPSTAAVTLPPTAAPPAPANATAPVADAAPPPATAATVPASDGVSREVPTTVAEVASAPPVPGPWSAVTRTTAAGYVATDVGCADGTSAAQLDAFFRERVGPVIGEDYQHVVPLGGGRHLWIFQDTFLDPAGTATRLDHGAFVHNVAMVQDGACFTLHHRGTDLHPTSFEPGTGERPLATWFWPMGGELVGGQVVQFWAEMRRDGYTPGPVDGLGWHPVRTWIGAYDARSLQRLSFAPAPDDGVAPIYGYALATQGDHTYLFGNTFEQNLVREGGYANGPHSATAMYLARVPAGQFGNPPEYRTADGWSTDPAAAAPIAERFWVENPMQPRYVGGQWASVAKVDGYWGEELAVDVAPEPWGPWTTVERRPIVPRGSDPKMNTYHAHLMPWLEGGQLVVSISQNARDMTRDAYPVPSRYRIALFRTALVEPPRTETPAPETPAPAETTTTVEETSTTAAPTTSPETSTTPQPTTTVDPTSTSAAATTGPPATTAPPTSSTAPSTATTAATTTTATTAPGSTGSTTTVPAQVATSPTTVAG